MTELLTSAQMRAVEAAAIASGAVTGLELMERAGAGVVAAVLAEWPELAAGPHRAVVLCGPGNNGGDGFVVARLLRERGWAVEVFFYGDVERLPSEARSAHARWSEVGEVRGLGCDSASGTGQFDLCIDALFGTGVSRAVDARITAAVSALCDRRLAGARRVAVDIGSGLCADSGRVLTEAGAGTVPLPLLLPPDLTVTFHRAKTGHYLAEDAPKARRLRVVDIGLEAAADDAGKPRTTLVGTPSLMLGKDGGHKYSHGHALIISGPSGHGGAARLAARGALRIGAGVVTVGCAPETLAEHAARLEAVMLRPMADAPALAAVLEDGRINSLCLGPAMGMGPREAGLLAMALELSAPPSVPAGAEAGRGARRRALVLDADALTLIARDSQLFGALQAQCVLTPHAGEFARLFPDIAARLAAPAQRGPAYSKPDATREAAARAGCVVLFKGADTVIAAPDGRCAVNAAVYDRAAPWLATAGAGDVLAGFICGLLARGFAPFEAACTAAWLHVACARSFGPGLIAEDLPEELPKVFRALGL
ncbi:NAD(P)H-hydrate dehydratase [Pseudotabrizicola formosa]|uniref:NAD(P)H-hydrate dehydratase n=1 Tax=Pseudotabrizicola formosa TaxID=2030009 RepID=UPI000CD2944E|nr:NAD(P)H-hydrate dehydratase [Pseudotabrizicola formosa]